MPSRIGRRTRTSARKAEAIVAVAGLAAGSTLAPGAPAGSATTTRDSLRGVACISPTACFAVGGADSVSSRSARTVIERWNGQRWSKVASPNPTGATTSYLFGISCVSATSCFAVGNTGSYGARMLKSLVERWNGKTWSIVKTPNAGPLTSVSCISATACFAAGTNFLRWNHQAWSTVTNATGYAVSMSCASATSCMAVGDSGATRWNGKAWSTVPTPKPGNPVFEGFGLSGVSCTSSANCVAVGDDAVPLDNFTPLSERWNGKTWSKLPTPDPTPAGYFNAVSCTSTTNCFAVGDVNPNDFRAFVERWDGTTWSAVAIPSFGAGESWLASVSCSRATSCFAVGYLDRPYFNDEHVLVERWDGNAWTVVNATGSGTS